jgi:hypothetical protein
VLSNKIDGHGENLMEEIQGIVPRSLYKSKSLKNLKTH